MQHRSRVVAPIALVAFLLALAPAARADGEEGPATGPRTIAQLLVEARDVAGLPLVWHPQDRELLVPVVPAELRLEGDRAAKVQALRSFLALHDIVVVPTGRGTHEHLLVASVRSPSIVLRLKPEPVDASRDLEDLASQDGRFVLARIELPSGTDLARLRMTLAQTLTPQGIGRYAEAPDGSAIVVADFAPNVAAVARLAAMLHGAPDHVVRVVALEHARARELAAVLEAHVAPVATPTPTGPAAGAPARIRIQADARTNQLVVSGDPAEVEAALEVIARLDVPVQVESTFVHVVPLANATANDAANTLQRLIVSSPRFARAARPVTVPDARTNSLLIEATAEDFEVLKAIVEQIDVPVADR